MHKGLGYKTKTGYRAFDKLRGNCQFEQHDEKQSIMS